MGTSGGNSITLGVTGATIAGGGGNFDMPRAPIPGAGTADANTVTDDWGTVGGGLGNQAGDNAGTVSDQPFGTVGGGYLNTASGFAATVAGGSRNIASGDNSTVAGGNANTASGEYSVVAGGDGIAASGIMSFAAGCGANAVNDGAFVWGGFNGAGCTAVYSSAAGQFIAAAPGGVIFYSNFGLSTGVSLAAGGGSWSMLSDRNVKANLVPVNGRTLLARLNAIPMASWNYKAQPATIRHLGPMAQDFYAAFGLGEDDKHITTVDEGGVALAGVQALYRLSLQKDAEIRKLQAQNRKLAAEVGQLRQIEAREVAQNQRLTADVERLKKVEAEMTALEARLARVEVRSARQQGGSAARGVKRRNPGGAARLEAKVDF
jgi:hypothetical protein